VDCGLDSRVGVVGVVWKELKEGFRETRGGVVLALKNSIGFLGQAASLVVTEGLWGLVGMRSVVTFTPMEHEFLEGMTGEAGERQQGRLRVTYIWLQFFRGRTFSF
jgi:hypothetical protein